MLIRLLTHSCMVTHMSLCSFPWPNVLLAASGVLCCVVSSCSNNYSPQLTLVCAPALAQQHLANPPCQPLYCKAHTIICWFVFAVLGLLVACLYWAIFATYLRARRQPAPFRNYIYPRMIMSCILVLFYLYPSSTAVIVSLFSCTPVDVLANPAQMEDIMKYGESAAVRAVGDHWNQDTTLLCWQGTHAWLAYGFGIAGIVLFAVGFPIGIAYVLWRNRKRLQEQKVRGHLTCLVLEWFVHFDTWHERVFACRVVFLS